VRNEHAWSEVIVSAHRRPYHEQCTGKYENIQGENTDTIREKWIAQDNPVWVSFWHLCQKFTGHSQICGQSHGIQGLWFAIDTLSSVLSHQICFMSHSAMAKIDMRRNVKYRQYHSFKLFQCIWRPSASNHDTCRHEEASGAT
jgi:hypothetical protein